MNLRSHVVTAENRHLYDSEMEAYHRLRRAIDIEKLRWPRLVPGADDLEIDRFELPTTTQILAMRDDHVVGCARLNSTEGPHLLADVLPHLAAAEGVPRGPDVLEWTRIFVADDVLATGCRPAVSDVVVAALMQHAVEIGATAITTVLDIYWLPRLLRYGWRVDPLCMPVTYKDEWLIGSLIHVSEEAVASIRSRCGITRSPLVRTRLRRTAHRRPKPPEST